MNNRQHLLKQRHTAHYDVPPTPSGSALCTGIVGFDHPAELRAKQWNPKRSEHYNGI